MRDAELITVFPTTESNWYNENVRSEGMLLRDYFAAKAMNGDWSAQTADTGYFADATTTESLQKNAELYYRMADAMLRAREK